MKKLFLILNPLYPWRDHNSNLILKIAPFMDVDTHIISTNANNICWNLPYDKNKKDIPKEIDNIPVTFTPNNKLVDKLALFAFRRLFSEEQSTSLLLSLKLYFASLFRIRKSHAVLSTNQWIFTAFAASLLGKRITKSLFLMDPSHSMYTEGIDVKSDSPRFLRALSKYDVVFTTRFTREVMEKKGYSAYAKKIVDVSFPMITGFDKKSNRVDDGKILLLYSGKLYLDSSIRSPKYFLKIISRLDSRFRIVFAGEDAPQLLDVFPIETEAEIVLLPHMNSDDLQQYMANADVLVNIGNSVPVHLPSKTLEYINTGKPIVNLHKFDDCPTLHYTKRYPLCLNINENDENIEKVTKDFIEFCLQVKGKSMEQSWIAENYSECTPRAIGETIMTTLNQIYDEKHSN